MGRYKSVETRHQPRFLPSPGIPFGPLVPRSPLTPGRSSLTSRPCRSSPVLAGGHQMSHLQVEPPRHAVFFALVLVPPVSIFVHLLFCRQAAVVALLTLHSLRFGSVVW